MEKKLSWKERLIPFKVDLTDILHTNKTLPLPLRVVLLIKEGKIRESMFQMEIKKD